MRDISSSPLSVFFLFSTAYTSCQDKFTVLEKKKAVRGPNTQISATQDAMIGVIIHAVNQEKNTSVGDTLSRRNSEPIQAEMEIIDPDFGHIVLSERSQKAGQYWHYAGAAIFAGLYDVALEFIERANATMKGAKRINLYSDFSIDQRDAMPIGNDQKIIGIQWRPSDLAELPDDVWFYQGIDRNVLREILVNDVFPSIGSFHYDFQNLFERPYPASILPDGSYFGISTKKQDALRAIDLSHVTDKDLRY